MQISAAFFALSCLSLGADFCGAISEHGEVGSVRSARFSRLASAADDVVSPEIDSLRRVRRLSSKGNKSQKSTKGSKSKSKTKSKKSHKSPKNRKCTYKERDDSVQLKCSSHEADIKDKIDFTLTTGELGAVVQVKYKLDDKSDTDEDGAHHKVEEEYEIYFSSLVEYLPTGTSSETGESLGYGWSGNETIQMMDLSAWGAFSEITKDEDGVLQFYVETTDGVVRLNFKLSEERMEDRHLSASRMKIDVTVADFPWEGNNTLVTLLSKVQAKTGIKTHYHETHESHGSQGQAKSGKSKKSKPKHPTEVEISYGNASSPFGEFVWVTSADIGNSTNSSEVIATSPPEHEIPPGDSAEGIQYIAFSFLNSSDADYIYWDPDVGVVYPDSDSTTTAAALSSAGGTTQVTLLYSTLSVIGYVFLGHMY